MGTGGTSSPQNLRIHFCLIFENVFSKFQCVIYTHVAENQTHKCWSHGCSQPQTSTLQGGATSTIRIRKLKQCLIYIFGLARWKNPHPGIPRHRKCEKTWNANRYDQIGMCRDELMMSGRTTAQFDRSWRFSPVYGGRLHNYDGRLRNSDGLWRLMAVYGGLWRLLAVNGATVTLARYLQQI